MTTGAAIVIETDRLLLREMSTADADFMLAILNDPDFIRYIGDRGVRTQGQARDYLTDRVLKSYTEHGFGMYAVERKTDQVVIGICGLVRREHLDAPDIGFAFLPEFRNAGYGLESAAAVLEFTVGKLRIDRVLAIATPDNLASNALLERLGMRLEQVTRLAEDDANLNLYVYESASDQ